MLTRIHTAVATVHFKTLLTNNSKDAVALEQRLTAAHLAHQLARRATQEELQKRGLYTDSTRAAHELEFKLNQRLLAQRLKKRPAVCTNTSLQLYITKQCLLL
jgi:hypothetical protein